MPVVFASADLTDRLIYYATLKDVEINESDLTTTYEFTGLQKIASHLPLGSLKLRSTNRALSDNYIRPYAVCLTPSFVE
jgi:hypothetical protein